MMDPFDASDGPPVLGGACVLTADEATVGLAYTRLVPLLERLVEQPFSRHLYQELREYLEGDAWEAAQAFERLRELGADHLTARLAVLEGATAGGRR